MLKRVYDGHFADLLVIGVDACRWFTRLIPMSYQSSIFRHDARIEKYNWVVYPMRGPSVRGNKLFCRAVWLVARD
jgi:hypothetical protein